jgi:hypothetical protein
MLAGVLIAELSKKISGPNGQAVRSAALRAVADTALNEVKGR